ncbi:DUF6415 family natural product biosynthesis protein [Streptomyces sp. GbtcB6]|uniref:DUF6415 family natural product biosynthesis protein n=1 Tax=Streptomyces sp. GbtcB6 TaxID=2824751 RepID=UPI001C304683|nr:DUF6415 family natural product biosynthesis protein [Streptomyces sp. GbtcB6]
MSMTAPNPPDIRAMRVSIGLVLATDIPKADPGDPDSRDAPELHFTGTELDALTVRYRDHVRTLIPVVEARAQLLPERHANRVAALMCAGQARVLLRAEPAETNALRGSIAVRLARSVRTLCAHYDRLVSR